MSRPLPNSEIRGTNHGPAGRPRTSAPADRPVVPGAHPFPSSAPQDAQNDEAAAAASARLAPQPFDLTQAAYALEVVAPSLRMLDEAGQSLVVMMGPGAVRTRGDALRFHLAVSNLRHVADFIERLAQHEDHVFALLQALERGDDVRLICTDKSTSAGTAVREGA